MHFLLTPHIAGLSAFEPGRISDNFMKRFDSPTTANEEVAVSRPKKKLISFDQVMRRVSLVHWCSIKITSYPDTFVLWRRETTERYGAGRDQECKVTKATKVRKDINIFRKSWCPPDESELSFNKVIISRWKRSFSFSSSSDFKVGHGSR